MALKLAPLDATIVKCSASRSRRSSSAGLLPPADIQLRKPNNLTKRGTGRPGRRANPAALLDRLLEALLEPIGRAARRRAAEAIQRKQD